MSQSSIKVNPSTNVAAVDVITDENATIHTPITKIATGAYGTVTPVSAAAPMPASVYANVDGTATLVDAVTKDGRTSLFTADGYTDSFTVHMDNGEISAQTAQMIIDISDTTNWPHTNTGHVNIEWIIIEADPDTAFLGEVKVGFLTNVDGTNGDFNQVIDIDMAKKSDLVIENMDFGSHGIDMEANHHFGPILANSTLFSTATNLKGPDGTTTFPSGNGDVVLLVERSAGTVDVSITIGYETAP